MTFFETLLQDLRYGRRTLLRNAGFTTVSVFAWALGIGFNTAVFTAYKAFVARPLDARDPGMVVNLRAASPIGRHQCQIQLAGLRSLSGPSPFVRRRHRVLH